MVPASPRAVPRWGVWSTGVVLLIALAGYAFSLREEPSSASQRATSMETVAVSTIAAPAMPAERRADTAMPSESLSTPPGAATIETVAAVAPALTAVAPPVMGAAFDVRQPVSATTAPIAERQPSVRATSAPARPATSRATPSKAASTKRPQALAKAQAKPDPKRESARQKGTASPASPAADGDAELLAAMLPHLQRLSGPTSPAHARRCGTLKDKAAEDCLARFCNGREGADAACR